MYPTYGGVYLTQWTHRGVHLQGGLMAEHTAHSGLIARYTSNSGLIAGHTSLSVPTGEYTSKANSWLSTLHTVNPQYSTY